MSALLHKLGLSTKVGFHDVFSIDEPELLEFVPRPAHALLLVFPVSDTYEKFRLDEDSSREVYQGFGPDEEVVWYKQTIGNACGLIGVLHSVSNGAAKSFIGTLSRKPLQQSPSTTNFLLKEPGSNFSKLLNEAIPLKPDERADLLYESQALESAHQTAASGGDTSAPEADASVDLHYVCFVKSENGHLWELDGRRKGPLDRGVLDPKDDVLSEKALELGVRSFLKREAEAGGGDLRFSLIVLSPSLD